MEKQMSEEAVIEAKQGIKETKEMLAKLMDALESMASEYQDGAKIVAEMKDLELAEYLEIGMLVVMRLPALLAAFKKPAA